MQADWPSNLPAKSAPPGEKPNLSTKMTTLCPADGRPVEDQGLHFKRRASGGGAPGDADTRTAGRRLLERARAQPVWRPPRSRQTAPSSTPRSGAQRRL